MEKLGRKLVSLNDYETIAAPYGHETSDKVTGVKCGDGLLPKTTIGYYSSGSGDELTLIRNRSAFAWILLRPRMMRNVATVDLSTTLLSNTYSSPTGNRGLGVSMPVGIAPTAFHRLAHVDGERATAKVQFEF
eukprot:GHVS01030482.1.p1 GENE.GHVS01030482.1~~GHVS01030482.1.p1  ORF type:complete len:133 (-),score=6.88 GHVS01030482.1:1084-1482(-)